MISNKNKYNNSDNEDLNRIIKNYREFHQFDTDEAWEKINTNLKLKQNEKIRYSFKLQYVIKYASLIILVIISINLFRSVYLTNKKLKEYTTIKTNNEIKSFNLPDGSTIWLNRNTTIKYFSKFQEKREVNISGEAYFNVKPDEFNKFIVKCKNKKNVEVLGTSFLVSTYPESNYLLVFVDKGKVKITDLIRKKSIDLITGQTCRADKNLLVYENTDKNILSWKTKKIIFNYTPLIEVAQILEKVYGIRIIFKNEEIKKCEYTATFDNQSFESVIKSISETFEFEIINQNDNIIIFKTKNETGCGQ